MKQQLGSTLGATLAAAVALSWTPAYADSAELRNPEVSVPASENEQVMSLSSREFGVGKVNILQIPVAAFHPETSTQSFGYKGNMYWGPNAGTGGSWAWAPVTLPSGAYVYYVDLYYNDTNAAADMTVYLRKNTGQNGVPTTAPSYRTVGSVKSTGSAGYNYAVGYISGGETINNNARYSADGGQYTVEAYFPADTGLSLAGVDIWWHRQVSPAPATATFSDVPKTHWAFQYVEALRASGITSGTTATTFNPTGIITRAEFAVFMSRALGLHWDH